MKTQPITLDIGRRRIVHGIVLGAALLLCGALALILVSRTAETDRPRSTTAVVSQPYNAGLVAFKLAQAERVADATMALPLPQAVTRADFAALKLAQAERVADATMALPLPQAVTRADFAALKLAQAERVADAAMALPLPQAVTRADFAALKLAQAERVADAAMALPLRKR